MIVLAFSSVAMAEGPAKATFPRLSSCPRSSRSRRDPAEASVAILVERTLAAPARRHATGTQEGAGHLSGLANREPSYMLPPRSNATAMAAPASDLRTCRNL